MDIQVPDIPESVIGWRAWRIRNTYDPILCGMYKYFPWEKGLQRAACAKLAGPRKKHPIETCSCGFHAYHSIYSTFPIYSDIAAQKGLVVGLISGGGDIMVHARSFRAEYAKIELLVVPSRLKTTKMKYTKYTGVVEFLASKYDVPFFDLADRRSINEVAREAGNYVPESLRPPPPKPPSPEVVVEMFKGITLAAQDMERALGAVGKSLEKSLSVIKGVTS